MWRYALDLLGCTVEYEASRNSVIRFNSSTTLIHYLRTYTDPNPSSISVISTEFYSLKGSPDRV